MNIPAVLSRLGIEVSSERGDELNALCPMHKARTGRDDQNPSWGINTETGKHKCFSCGYAGGLRTLVRDVLSSRSQSESTSKDEVDRWLGGLDRPSELDSSRIRLSLEGATQYRVSSKVAPMTEARLSVYSPVPQDALDSRGLTREACDSYGLLWSSDDEWIIPIRDPHSGSLWGWQLKGSRNRLFRNKPAGVTKSLTLFSEGPIRASRRFVLVESPLDAVRLGSLGVQGGVASFGASVSDTQLRLLTAADEVVVALDNDPAGRSSSSRLLKIARHYGLILRFFDYSETSSKDIGDMTPEEISRGLGNSRHMVRGMAALS